MTDIHGHRPGLFAEEDITRDASGVFDGTGGFGAIYKAKLKTSTGSVKVALKLLRYGSDDDVNKVSPFRDVYM